MANYENDMAKVRKRLEPYYTPQEIEKWLVTPHPLLSNRPAVVLIQEGQTALVERAIQSFEDCAYL